MEPPFAKILNQKKNNHEKVNPKLDEIHTKSN